MLCAAMVCVREAFLNWDLTDQDLKKKNQVSCALTSGGMKRPVILINMDVCQGYF